MQSVLIVENNQLFRSTFKEILQHHLPNTSIEEASNHEEAWQKIEALQPTVIFIDIRLPGKSGLELTREIKKRYSRTTVTILTNYDIPEYRNAAYRYGADHFLLKDSLTANDIAVLAKTILLGQSSFFQKAAIGYAGFASGAEPPGSRIK